MTLSATSRPSSDDIAVIGLACLFPGAPDVRTFWRNIISKASAITDPPPEAWALDPYYDPSSDENDRVYCKKGGYLGPLAFFDPIDHGIMPRSVEGGEPDQWLALHVAREAFRDAGYPDTGPQRRQTALILGKGTYPNRGTMSVVNHAIVIDYTLRLLKSVQPELTDEDLDLVRQDLKRRLPRFDAETAPALIPNVTVGRIANRLDLMGPSYTVDAACASSLVAIDTAVKGLRQHEYDSALVGGMQVATPVPVLSLFCRLKALSLTECIRPFDKDADGTMLSEGLGMAVLKRRADAERDGDRIYAFIKGTGVASDGRAVSVLAPRVEGEELALQRAYEAAGVGPRSVGLIEAHGTATLVGDAVEVEALARVFGGREGLPHCALGSVKSMIGHTMPAAGMAGFIKAALALYHKVVPPTLNVTEPSPRLHLDRTPFYINTETRPWIHGGDAHPRRAGINAFGFGGINAHVVLEEGPSGDDSETFELDWDTEVCLLTGRSREEVTNLARQVLETIAEKTSLSLADVAFTLNTQAAIKEDAPVSVALVASSIEDLSRKLEKVLKRLADPACRKIKDVSGIYFFEEPLVLAGTVAFLFPGEGAQYVNMLSDLCRHFPVVRACFDEMDRLFANHPRGFVLSDLVFPPPVFTENDRIAAEQRLWQMDVAVEALYTANHAMYLLLSELEIRPEVMLGHSTGEYSAMRAAQMLREDRYQARLHAMNAVYEGAAAAGKVPALARLFAVGAARERVAAACASFGADVSIAMDNCRHQVVVVARSEVGSRLEDVFRGEGLLYEVLPFDRPYHTPDFEEYAQELREFLADAIARPPSVPVYSATSADLFPADPEAIRRLAYDHWMRPVEFRRTIEKMYADGVRIFVEVGPRGNLTAFVDDILAGRSFAAIPANVSRRSGTTQLNHCLAQLAAHGVQPNLATLYRRRRVAAVDLTGAAATASKRPLGRVKIPTGAPEMSLSPDVIAHLRSRRGPSSQLQQPDASQLSIASRTAPEAQVATANIPTARVEAQPAAAEPGHLTSRVATGVAPQPPESAEAAGSSSQVMSAFARTMGRFLDTEQALMSLSLGDAQARGQFSDRIDGRLPFIDLLLSHRIGEELVARCTIDLERCPFLWDHMLGRQVSADDVDLPAFPIVPFTLMMEIMAEGAVALVPSAVLTEMRQVRVHRWIAVDRGAVVLEIRARRSGEQVSVQLLEADVANASPIAEGVMVLGETYPNAPPADTLDLPDAHAYKWPHGRLYEEAMFHGPSFRGVGSVDRVGQGGASASLVVLDRMGLLPGGRAAGLVTDFVLLDLPGQVVGFWASQCLDRGFLVLPTRLESLKLYGPPPAAGEPMWCTVRVALVGSDQLRSILEIVRPDGRVWARFDGWDDHRFDLPDAAFRMLLDPGAATLSRLWHLTTDAAGRGEPLAIVRIGPDSLPSGWLVAHGGLWSRVLAAIVLSRRERDAWNRLTLPPRRRIEWLLGRIAAKDAVRALVLQRFGLTLYSADVELIPDENGRPTVEGAWTGRLRRAPLVSISHVDGVAIAIAEDGEGAFGVGVDLERLGRLRTNIEPVAFNFRERELLDGFDEQQREVWSLRLWCAKEASAKAIGVGMAVGLRALAAEAIDPRSGVVHIRFETPGREARNLLVRTAQDGEWIVASCVVGASVSVGT